MNGSNLEYLTYEKMIEKVCKLNDPKYIRYWAKRETSILKRWQYMKEAIKILRENKPKDILEIGCMRIPLCEQSDLFELKSQDLVNDNGFICDLNDMPYNVPDKKYDFSVALQVWEHLDDQSESFSELCRISKNIILSFPYKWNGGHVSHRNIDEEVIRMWTNNIEPYSINIIDKYAIYFFKDV